jgi:hypothetical protein
MVLVKQLLAYLDAADDVAMSNVLTSAAIAYILVDSM